MVVTEHEVTVLTKLPDIHREIAKSMHYFGTLTKNTVSSITPDKQLERTLELTNLWLEIQKEEALAIYHLIEE